jgi:hypothetical protein
MSELSEAFAIARALPALQKQEVERVAALLYRLPIAEVATLGDAIEHQPRTSLREALMRERGEVVRVAEWYVDAEQRCQLKRYEVGNTQRAKIGNIGDAPTWIEAWIA